MRDPNWHSNEDTMMEMARLGQNQMGYFRQPRTGLVYVGLANKRRVPLSGFTEKRALAVELRRPSFFPLHLSIRERELSAARASLEYRLICLLHWWQFKDGERPVPVRACRITRKQMCPATSETGHWPGVDKVNREESTSAAGVT